ncbi:hypothetical protein [Halovivax limisalsi]|uniref:hypothetical protein n=1 Tax=Halovivax limisalsi TaxID=1453760 RepID=UPI001FFD3037|nr:hypothetical protein [Halovivax limisalsi]
MYWHPQDDLILIEALLLMARLYPDNSEMYYHCWALADEIAYDHGLTLADALRQRVPLE